MNCIESQLLSRFDWLKHGFSVGPLEIGDLVDENSTVFDTEQVHGNAVHLLDCKSVGRVLRGDGFVASRPKIVCHVRTADCVPILIADAKAMAVGAIHAGWKGTAEDVVGEVVRTMCDRFGTDPIDCFAAIGPRICGNCYEVGREVVDAIAGLNLDSHWRSGDRHVDLGCANRGLLERAGVPSESIEVMPHCTSCDGRFASWRRDRANGRQVSYIFRRDTGQSG